MNIKSGQTVYEQILSLDVDNNPVIAGVTFNSLLYKDNTIYTASTPYYSLTDVSAGVFTFSWSADTIGDYQLYVKNISTNVIFVSDHINIRPDSEFDNIIYIGL